MITAILPALREIESAKDTLPATRNVSLLPIPAAPEPAALVIGHAEKPSELAAALAAAREHCKPAAKDSYNDYHKYDYASCEGIINESKKALDGTGLSLIAKAPKLCVMGSGNLAVYEMIREVTLIHKSGEWLPLGEIHWPVCPDKGRPLDKAYASAITTSLAYFYRDLLTMPRVNQEDDLAGRKDSEKPAKQPKPNSPPAPAPGYITLDQGNELANLMLAKGVTKSDLFARFHITRWGELPLAEFVECKTWLLAHDHRITPPQRERIAVLAKQKGLEEKDLCNWIGSRWGREDLLVVADLRELQADELLAYLRSLPDVVPAGTTAREPGVDPLEGE